MTRRIHKNEHYTETTETPTEDQSPNTSGKRDNYTICIVAYKKSCLSHKQDISRMSTVQVYFSIRRLSTRSGTGVIKNHN